MASEEKKEIQTFVMTIEDLVSEVHILIQEEKMCVNRIPFKLAEDFGELLGKHCEAKGYRICLSLSRDQTSQFLHYNRDIYTEDEEKGFTRGIKFTSFLTSKELIKRFQRYYPIDIVLTILSDDFKKEAVELIREEERHEGVFSTDSFNYYCKKTEEINGYLSKLEKDDAVKEYLRLKQRKLDLEQDYSYEVRNKNNYQYLGIRYLIIGVHQLMIKNNINKEVIPYELICKLSKLFEEVSDSMRFYYKFYGNIGEFCENSFGNYTEESSDVHITGNSFDEKTFSLLTAGLYKRPLEIIKSDEFESKALNLIKNYFGLQNASNSRKRKPEQCSD